MTNVIYNTQDRSLFFVSVSELYLPNRTREHLWALAQLLSGWVVVCISVCVEEDKSYFLNTL